jgi:hypothetical protein
MEVYFMQRWTESERDWGRRPDGCSLHLTPEDHTSWIKTNNFEGNDYEYSFPDGGIHAVQITSPKVLEDLKSKRNLRLFSLTNIKVLS